MLSDLSLSGSLLPPDFVARELPVLLARAGANHPDPDAVWEPVRRGLRAFGDHGGPVRVLRHVLEPLSRAFGYRDIKRMDAVTTREGVEDGGYLARAGDGPAPRLWPVESGVDLESVSKHHAAARSSPARRAIRVARACGESIGVVTNGQELRVVLCDPSGPDGHIAVPLHGRSGWMSSAEAPASFRLIAALASPLGVASLGQVFEAGRLHQTAVTKTLRVQARAAIEGFLRSVLEREENRAAAARPDVLWRQALTTVYRLLFILKMESGVEPGRGFGFAAADGWRRGLSPNRALAALARRRLDLGQDTGRLLEDGLRILFRVFHEGLSRPSFTIAPLGGGLFDPAATEMLDGLCWGEEAVALLLDRLLWTTPRGQARGQARERVHYGSLDVEELGRVYESLLDLEPEIEMAPEAGAPPRFHLRAGLGRRSGGSYYTPREFVEFLVRETLTPLVGPAVEAADPLAILRVKVIDPAMGSGHFLVEACRFLAGALDEACRRCDAIGTPETLARIEALPDPDRRLSSYLPSRSRDTSDSGPSRARALAICRRLVAVHCLYGVDRDPLAVELAKVSLWLESFAEGMPLTFLDHRLVVGDSISGPFSAGMARLPVGGADLDPLLARGVADRLQALVRAAMADARRLEASIGTEIADIMDKERTKHRLDRLLSPLRMLAKAWSGAVRWGGREANDAWLGLAQAISETGLPPATLHPHQAELVTRGDAALPLDLAFPEVFQNEQGSGGFHAVLGNPPWDVVHYQTKEFLARFDSAVQEAPTKRERETIERRLLANPAIRIAFDEYKLEFIERKRLCDRMFPRPGPQGSIDLFQIFTERMLDCLGPGGALGIVVPSSIHANEGTAPLRRRLLNETRLESCFMFENRKKLFDVHGRLKFTLLTARKAGPTGSFRCAFYLDSMAGLREPGRVMTYDRAFLDATGGDQGAFLELRGQTDLRIARHMFVGRSTMRSWLEARRIVFGREAHMTDDSHRFVVASGDGVDEALPLHEGKTFHQYTDRWKTPPRYAIPFTAIHDKPAWGRAAGHYRLVFREIARSTDDRTMIAAMLPPGVLIGHKGTCEKSPWNRPDSDALILCAVLNSFSFDWCVRQKTAASMSLFMLHSCPAPDISPGTARFLAHAALRLSCGHAGYDQIWRTQLGPRVKPAEIAGWRDRLRAVVDAVVADAYGLSREHYAHVLGGFAHRSNPSAPEQCLAAFDELRRDGATMFHKRHDPFARVPLRTAPAQPAIASPTASPALIPSTPADKMPPA